MKKLLIISMIVTAVFLIPHAWGYLNSEQFSSQIEYCLNQVLNNNESKEPSEFQGVVNCFKRDIYQW